MMGQWTVYRSDTGELLRTFEGPEGSEVWQAQPGEALRAGLLDLKRQRIVDGEPAEYRPPSPQDGAQWSETEWRWVTRGERNAPILAQIIALEMGQARAVREALRDMPGAGERLAGIDAQIAKLRERLE